MTATRIFKTPETILVQLDRGGYFDAAKAEAVLAAPGRMDYLRSGGELAGFLSVVEQDHEVPRMSCVAVKAAARARGGSATLDAKIGVPQPMIDAALSGEKRSPDPGGMAAVAT